MNVLVHALVLKNGGAIMKHYKALLTILIGFATTGAANSQEFDCVITSDSTILKECTISASPNTDCVHQISSELNAQCAVVTLLNFVGCAFLDPNLLKNGFPEAMSKLPAPGAKGSFSLPKGITAAGAAILPADGAAAAFVFDNQSPVYQATCTKK